MPTMEALILRDENRKRANANGIERSRIISGILVIGRHC